MERIIKAPHLFVIIISLLFLIIPFFWIKPNEMDIGGDSTRLYFYNPQSFTINSLYFFQSITLGNRSFLPLFYFLPYLFLLLLIKSVAHSPYFLISFFNGIKISISFLSIYLIVRQLIQSSYKEKKELFLQIASILAGLLYTTAPIIIGNYDKALISHDQIFLYPLCFYLILRYFIKEKFRYLVLFVLVSVVFSPSFSWSAAPPFFAFFPLALSFLFLYIIFILKKRINFFHIIIALIFFLGLHAFHIIPEAYILLSPGNYVNQRVFSQSEISEDLNYFAGIISLSKLSSNVLLYASYKQFIILFIIPVLFMFLGLSFNKKKDKTLFLVGIFFLITLYLVTAAITNSGIKLYKLFFYLPGFSMFRNFIGQWAFIYTFFYALLFGQALYFFVKKVNNIKVLTVVSVIIGITFIATSWNFFTGGIVNVALFQTNNVKIPTVMDPKYEQTLSYISTFTNDGSFVSFPFTDSYESVIHGLNNGAYEGPSPIYWLTGRLDYNGYQEISPFGEIFFKLAKDKDFTGIKKLLGILDIKYIYYNDDPKIYDTTFPGNPYNSARAFLPKTQKEYKKFIKQIAGKEIYHNGIYNIYLTDSSYFHPEFYPTKQLRIYKQPEEALYTISTPFFNFSSQTNDTYIDNKTCAHVLPKNFCSQKGKQFSKLPDIQFQEINPTFYQVHVKNAQGAYLLVFSTSYDNSWDISLSKNNYLKDLLSPDKLSERQLMVNGYANAWYIFPHDVGNKSNYTLTVQLSDQKVFYISAVISLLTLLIALGTGIFFLFRR